MKDQDFRISTIDAATTRALGAASDFAAEAPSAEPVRRPYRGVPRDFVERWPQVGWGKVTGAEAEWNAHARTISRWLDECGRSEMILARKRYLDAQRAVAGRARRKRYVLGRTLNPIAGQGE